MNIFITLLLLILFCSLVSGIVSFFFLFSRKYDERFEKVSTFATVLSSIGSLAVGFITVNVMMNQEKAEQQRNQPIYSVYIDQTYSPEKRLYDNEEYVIKNEGYKTRSKTDVSCFTIFEVTYTEDFREKAVTKCCRVDNYFGAGFATGNLDGAIKYSAFSGNNNERFYDLYAETLRYQDTHPGMFVMIKKTHFFKFEYVDIYDQKHTVVKNNEDKEMDPEQLAGILKKADVDCGGIPIDFDRLDLNMLLDIFFSEKNLLEK